MAASAAGIFSQLPAMHGAITANAQTGNDSDVSGSDSASISANDFLTLLVTEMKNQDPTANTDPNEYINQLVQVNSLQQLISINQTLTSDSALSRKNTAEINNNTPKLTTGQASAEPPNGPPGGSLALPPLSPAERRVSGNLTIPATTSAAIRVAHALTRN